MGHGGNLKDYIRGGHRVAVVFFIFYFFEFQHASDVGFFPPRSRCSRLILHGRVRTHLGRRQTRGRVTVKNHASVYGSWAKENVKRFEFMRFIRSKNVP